MAVAVKGNFVFHYIPEDNYIVQASAVAAHVPGLDSAGLPSGAVSAAIFVQDISTDAQKPNNPTELALAVTGDVNDLNISVPDPQ